MSKRVIVLFVLWQRKIQISDETMQTENNPPFPRRKQQISDRVHGEDGDSGVDAQRRFLMAVCGDLQRIFVVLKVASDDVSNFVEFVKSWVK